MKSNVQKISPRIISGEKRGQKIKIPPKTRPVTDRVKKTIFDIIGSSIRNAKVLDIFAGSGNLGLECLSRGALFVTFVEKNYLSSQTIQENLNKLKINKDQYEIINKDMVSFSRLYREKYDFIFIDPPFKFAKEVNLELIRKFLKTTTIIVIKIPIGDEFEGGIENFEIIIKKIIGINLILFLHSKTI